MPRKEREPRRVFYEVKDLRDLLDVTKTAISFWIKYFELDISRREKSQRRKFTEDDVVDLLAIRYLVRDELYTLEGAKVKFKLWKRQKFDIPHKYLDIPDDLRYDRMAQMFKLEMDKKYKVD